MSTARVGAGQEVRVEDLLVRGRYDGEADVSYSLEGVKTIADPVCRRGLCELQRS